jgi:hypothetical protein
MVTAIFRRILKVGHTRTKGRRLGKSRDENNFPASHGNKRESDLTVTEAEKMKRGIGVKGKEKQEKRER